MAMSPFQMLDTSVKAGTRAAIEMPIARDSAGRWVTMPIRVLHGTAPGPTLLVSAAIHGDEITGIDIIRRLLEKVNPRRIRGTLIAVPIVNPFGFVAGSRYLPDRRDLNRSFPGREDGSLASRIAYLFRTECMARADFGIDLHSAAVHRYNFPQVRVSPSSEKALAYARAFAPPIIMHSSLRDGSMRGIALEEGLEMLLFEAGEALRFDPLSTRMGVNGILRTMEHMGMLDLKTSRKAPRVALEASRSIWIRSSRGGIAAMRVTSGKRVQVGTVLARVRSPIDMEEEVIKSPIEGIVIGHSRMGAVNRGDALLHIAQLGDAGFYLDPETERRLSGVMLDEHEVD